MSHRLCEASLHVTRGRSVIVPVIVTGIPERIEALGRTWARRREFHLTVVSAAAIERSAGGRADVWEIVEAVLSGRAVGPVSVRAELRVGFDPERPGPRTVIAMADAPGVAALIGELAGALGTTLAPPPMFVALYASDPALGVGVEIEIDDADALRERAPELAEAEHAELRAATAFDEALFDDGGIPADPCGEGFLALGKTDRVFTPQTMRAIAYAGHVHRHQRRKSTGIPYLAHLISVAALVAEDGGGEREVIAALLHDTAEDHGGEPRLADIGRRFGDEVASMVRALSDSLRPQGALKEAWQPRKQHYIDHLRTEQRPEVLRVSNADKLHNARAILADHRQVGPAIWRRFDGTPEQQLWYYSSLSALFTERRPESALARELAETVKQLAAETRVRA